MTSNTIPQSLFERFESEWRQVRDGVRAPAKPIASQAAK